MPLKKSIIKPIILVILCTAFTSLGQILWKISSTNLNTLSNILTNIPLILGIISYGLGAMFLIIALKYGELSLIYPFIALSFIWVSLSAMYLFKEQMTLINWIGIIAIMIGVSLIGQGGKK